MPPHPGAPVSKSTSARARILAASLTAAALIVTGGAVAIAPAAAAERTFALAGSLQSELGCPDDWQPACAATELAPTGTANVYAAEFEVPAGSYEYKVAVNDAWDESYGLNGGGDNIPLTVGRSRDAALRVRRHHPPRRRRGEEPARGVHRRRRRPRRRSGAPARQPGAVLLRHDRPLRRRRRVEQRGRAHGRPPRDRVRPDRQGLLHTAATSRASARSSTTSRAWARRRSG